uniref:Protein PML-like n=1 Tax=Saccoglossus kowalevskii TaxID=10224 RepID=A0ABM0M2V3_SACKO|nr:PREDICTED: protein PML-like [Saccoglossus kowalevskii]
MKSYIGSANDLARMGSTQGIENMNMVIASKAPKAKYYSVRVAAAVAQKNIGHTYVNQKHNLSPSSACHLSDSRLDEKAKTREAKLQRLKPKEQRSSDAEITQLSAVTGEKQFEGYILPKQHISPVVSRITHLMVKNGELCYQGQPVKTMDLKTCLEKFLYFLLDVKNPILVGHSNHSFDCRYLITAIKESSFIDRFMAVISGFVNTLPLFKSVFPDKGSYAQQSLVDEFVGQVYSAQNASADVLALQK